MRRIDVGHVSATVKRLWCVEMKMGKYGLGIYWM